MRQSSTASALAAEGRSKFFRADQPGGAALNHDFYSLLWVMGGLLIGGTTGGALMWRRIQRQQVRPSHQPTSNLFDALIAMDDALQEVAPETLRARGDWDRAQFDDVLHRVETLTPAFQAALVSYLSSGTQDRALITALLAVDRLSAAYTYWTRLFPPRQSSDAMFVLSLLHDLGEKVVTALQRLEQVP